MTLRVVVADDSADVRRAVLDVLATEPDLRVVTVRDGSRCLAALDRHGADVVVFDLDMPGGGPGLAAEVVARHPGTGLLCLTARDDADTVLAVLAAGATGFVAKGSLDADLAGCVRHCAAGHLTVLADSAPEVRRRLAGLLRGPDGR